MERDFYNIPVSFEPGSFAEPMTSYRFAILPQIGDEVVGEEAIYRVQAVIHSKGLWIDTIPAVEVLLTCVRKISH